MKIVVPESSLVFKVVEVDRERVLIGIDAPATTKVYRRELWDAICAGSPTITDVDHDAT